MITNKDRTGLFGASDTKYIMSNWDTSTFMSWFQSKIGTKDNSFSNVYTISGSIKEHQLSDHYSETHKEKVILDRQVRLKKLKLRVNLDCETKTKIIEIKTHKYTESEWKMPKEYVWQVWVQMFATKKRVACIYAYAMKDEDYDNFFLPIDKERIDEIPIEYNEQWIKNEYLPRLVYLANCLIKRKTPNYDEFLKEKNNV